MTINLSFRQQAEIVQQFCLDECERISSSQNPNKLDELAKLTRFKLDAMEFFQRKVQDEFQSEVYQRICELKTEGGCKKQMNELTTYMFNTQPVRTTMIGNDPWFVGKDVATILGYSDPLKAIRVHVDEDDKGVDEMATPGGNQSVIIINESGLYALVFGSKLPEAKKFKRWVTSEVLPALRKTGGYQIPKEPMEALKLMFEIQTTDNERINAVESKVEDLTENAPLTSFEYNYLAQKVKQCVARAKVLFTSISTGQAGMLYRTVSTDLNKFAGVRFRNQIRKGQFEDVCEFLENWELSTADLAKIKRAGDVCDNA